MLFGFFDPFANEEVSDYAENKNADVASTRFVVEEHACRKQEGVTQQDAVLDQGENGENAGEKSPEIELRKQQRTVRVKRKGAGEEWNQIVKHMQLSS